MKETGAREFRFEDDGRIPNNPTLPLLFYPRALSEPERDASRGKELLAENGWVGAWINGIFSYHHFHSTSHEVLCVVGGGARITFGGPEGEKIEVRSGDVVLRSAHRRRAQAEALESIHNVPLPETDPLFGEEGPLLRHW